MDKINGVHWKEDAHLKMEISDIEETRKDSEGARGEISKKDSEGASGERTAKARRRNGNERTTRTRKEKGQGSNEKNTPKE